MKTILYLVLVLLVTTFLPENATASNESAITVQNLRLVLSKRNDSGTVEQIIYLSPSDGKPTKMDGFFIPLPRNLPVPQLTPAIQEGVRIETNRLSFFGILPREGKTVSLQYNVAIENGDLKFNQQLGVEIVSLQVISTWTMGDAQLKVTGIEAAQRHNMNGMEVLLARGKIGQDGRIEATLSGLEQKVPLVMRQVTLVLAVAAMLIGLAAWFRNRKKHD